MHKRIFLAFHQRLFVLLLAFSWILVGCFVTFQYDREHQYRIERVNAQLQGINRQIIELLKDGLPIDTIQRRYLSRPENLRITLITTRGAVIYDSESPAIVRRIDHSRRPEVQQALRAGEGYTLARLSHSTNEEYFYSATLHDSLVVRKGLLRHFRLIIYQLIFKFVVRNRQNLNRQKSRILTAVYGDGCNRHSGRHLNDGKEAVKPVHRRALYGKTYDGEHGVPRNHSRKVSGLARRSNDGAESLFFRILGKRRRLVWSPVGA